MNLVQMSQGSNSCSGSVTFMDKMLSIGNLNFAPISCVMDIFSNTSVHLFDGNAAFIQIFDKPWNV